MFKEKKKKKPEKVLTPEILINIEYSNEHVTVVTTRKEYKFILKHTGNTRSIVVG